MNTSTIDQGQKVVSNAEWLEARKALLAKEKALTRQHDELSRERRELPWVKVEKNYIFDGPNGRETLGDLFAGRSQLMIYHFMFGPEWAEGCPSCSMLADHIDGSRVHLEHRDVTLLAVSRAPWSKIEPFKRRMGWRFKWVSSNANDFNYDYNVTFAKEDVEKGATYYNYGHNKFPSEEGPGISVFYKDDSGDIFHTYSAYARGAEPLLGVYGYMDLAPMGRNEDSLSFPMAWVRHHDRYDDRPQAKSAATGCGCGAEEALS